MAEKTVLHIHATVLYSVSRLHKKPKKELATSQRIPLLGLELVSLAYRDHLSPQRASGPCSDKFWLGSHRAFSTVPTPTGDDGRCDGSRSPGAIVDAAFPALRLATHLAA